MAGAGNGTKSEHLAKLAVSKSKSHRSAVVHNCAHDHELTHTLKAIDSIKDKASKSIDFEQRKFLQSLSLSTEDLRRVAQERAAMNRVSIHVRRSDDDLTGGKNKHCHDKWSSPARRTPSLTRLDLLKVQVDDLPRSFSDLDLRQAPKENSSFRTYSDKLVSNSSKQRLTDEGVMSGDKEHMSADPYSISSSMKISNSKGAFETCTGKSGLNAWMGKKVASPRIQRKVLY